MFKRATWVERRTYDLLPGASSAIRFTTTVVVMGLFSVRVFAKVSGSWDDYTV